MCKKENQKHKALQSSQSPQKGLLKTLHPNNPFKNMVSMASKDAAAAAAGGGAAAAPFEHRSKDLPHSLFQPGFSSGLAICSEEEAFLSK